MRYATISLFLTALAFAAAAGSNPAKDGVEYKRGVASENLYTPPDPGVSGGLSFKTSTPLEGAFAIPEGNQSNVYKGTVGADKKTVSFSGLPIAKYDLMIDCTNTVYEGYCLNRDEDSLTPQDIKFINVTIGQSVPFFDLKRLERMKGTTGRAGKATVLLQEMRIGDFLNQDAQIMKGHQIRSIKLAFCEDVGAVGWQVRDTREIIRTDVFPNMPHGLLPIKFLQPLEGIRVVTSVKDLGQIDLP